jgi:TPR repeat protein
VEKDYALAAVWCLKAADQGEAAGQFRVGTLYAFGAMGVKKDLPLGKRYLELSAAQGDEEAVALLKELRKCASCGKLDVHHMICAWCRNVRYCDGTCQLRHWQRLTDPHKPHCGRRREPAEADGSSSTSSASPSYSSSSCFCSPSSSSSSEEEEEEEEALSTVDHNDAQVTAAAAKLQAAREAMDAASAVSGAAVTAVQAARSAWLAATAASKKEKKKKAKLWATFKAAETAAHAVLAAHRGAPAAFEAAWAAMQAAPP